jgi:hypothetical protein
LLEGTLVERAQRGDEQAFATLYQLHNKLVYSVCLRMTKDVAEARRPNAGGFHPDRRTASMLHSELKIAAP